ncbi:TolC family protein [Acidimangrovimonas sediminis]|uniref:TolC family protein n=1 Tax=Acidimangrovimonas sediminis TaxID=2056283 RepID=UPI0013049498|nr:TolC family protein [Acidimangrovimonas sediminis]
MPRTRVPGAVLQAGCLGALCLALAAGAGRAAEQAAPLSLRQALETASARDAGISGNRQKIARQTTNIQSAKDALRPSLALAGDTTSVGDNIPVATLTLSQVLFDWGLARSKIRSASQARIKAVADLKSAVEDLALNVANLYIEVAIDKIKLRKTQDYLEFAQRIEKVSNRRVTAGAADRSEIARARLEVARAQDQIAQLDSDRQTAMTELEFYTGQPVAEIGPPPALSVTRRFKSSAAVIRAAMNAPDYLSAKAEVQIAAAAVDTARASRKPKIILKAVGLQELDGGHGTSASIGITTSLSFDAGNLAGRGVQGARQDLAAAKANQLAVERKLQNQLRTYVSQIQSLATTEQAQSAQLTQAEAVRQVYEQQFTGGQRELVDVLTAGRDLYDAQIDETDTFSQRLKTEYEAAHAVGMLGSLIIASGKRN